MALALSKIPSEVIAAERRFVTLDTAKQAVVLRRVGLTTDVGDRLVTRLRKSSPDRFRALCIAMPEVAEHYVGVVAA